MDRDFPFVVLTFLVCIGLSFITALCAANNVLGISAWWIIASFVTGLAGIIVPLAWLDRIR